MWWLLAFLNCRFVAYFLNLTCGLHKNSVYIDKVPVPLFSNSDKEFLSKAAKQLYEELRELVSTEEVSNLFLVPPAITSRSQKLQDGIAEWRRLDRARESRLWALQVEIEKIVSASIPAFEDLDAALLENQGRNPSIAAKGNGQPQMTEKEIPERCDKVARPILNRDNGSDSTDLFRFALRNTSNLSDARASLDESQFVAQSELTHEVASAFSWLLGCAFGRWDIRYATGERLAPELPDPFSPLPVCPPGMLQAADGFPHSIEEGRRLHAAGEYPLDVAWDGILVDDPEHPLDLIRCVHAAMHLLWRERVDDLEHEACTVLRAADLRDWFRRPAGFFADHLHRFTGRSPPPPAATSFGFTTPDSPTRRSTAP